MNDHPSPLSFMDGDRSASPKRKKMRQKYAPKACVSCRRSKLKCTGENPCQRCVDNGKRCFYSEDQTAAEVLQNLSRPAPTPVPAHRPSFGNSHSNNSSHVAPSRAMMPHDDVHEQSAEHAPAMTMEERMARMEMMMEALAHDRGLAFTPDGRLARDESVGRRSETAFTMPILDPIHPALDHMAQQSPERMLAETTDMGPDATAFVRAGNQNIPFPDPARYQQYVAIFFGDVHLRHPCVDETEFNARTQRVVTSGTTDSSDIHFLALCYVVFACCDVLLDVVPAAASDGDRPPGWQWYQLADGIVDKKSLLGGSNDLTLVQYLLYQALYLSYADMPSLAYATIRTACTTVLQQNLHQQTTWTECDQDQVYSRLCIFWNVYLSDRRISMSCGRPASLHIEDVDVEMPERFFTRLDTPIFGSDPRHKTNLCLQYEITTVQLTTSLLAQTRTAGNVEHVREFQSMLVESFDHISSGIFAPHPQSPIFEMALYLKRLTTLLVVGRKYFTMEPSNIKVAKSLGMLALTTARKMNELVIPPSCRHQVTSALAGMLSVIGILLLRNFPALEMSEPNSGYDDSARVFMQVVEVLRGLAQHFPYARRVHDEFLTVTSVVANLVERYRSLSPAQQASHDHRFVADMIPPNIEEGFPFCASCPPLHSYGLSGDWIASRDSGAGVLWIY